MSQTKTSSPSYAFVGLGVAVTGLLPFLLSSLSVFHLRGYVQFLLGALIVTIGATIACLGAAHTKRGEADEEERKLDAALAGWPPREVKELNAFDLGVRPVPGSPVGGRYLPRSEDSEVESAIHDAPMVLLVGPEGAGKTRSAYHAVRSGLPDATLLAPVDGPALGTLVANRERLGLGSDAEIVLWLDSLERFFQGLDIDALDRLMEWGPQLGWGRRAWLSALSWITGSPEPDDLFVPAGATTARVRVIATIRGDTLTSALNGEGDQAYEARRMVARMTMVEIAARPAPAVSTPVTSTAASGVSVVETSPDGPSNASDVSYREADLHARAPRGRPRPRVGRGAVALLLALLVGLSGLLAVVVERDGGWTTPPSFTDQAKSIRATLRACQTVIGEQPKVNGLSEGEAWTLMISSSGCPAPDAIRYYKVEHGLLTEQFTESPDSLAAWSFHCLGPASSTCRVSVPGGVPVLLGSYESSVSEEVLPLVLYGSAEEHVHMYSPFLPRPPRDSQDAGGGNQPLILPFHPGAASSPDPRAPKSCQRAATLCSYPADFLAAEPADEHHGALLIAGYVVGGTIYKPSAVELRVYGLGYDAGRQLVLDPRTCLFFDDGQERTVKEVVKVKSRAEVVAKMREIWTPRAHGEEAVIC